MFSSLIFTFLQLQQELTNPTIKQYEKTLETFLQQHYHEFLFKCTNRTEPCQAFIVLIQEFDKIPKRHKKHFVKLFDDLAAYRGVLGTLPGGHYKGTPFIFTDCTAQKWFYDEVIQFKTKYSNRCMYCHKKGTLKNSFIYPIEQDGNWTGHADCPANSIQICGTCPVDFDAIEEYLTHVGYNTSDISNDWHIFEKQATTIIPVLQEFDTSHTSSYRECIELLHEGSSAQQITEEVMKNRMVEQDATFHSMNALTEKLQTDFNTVTNELSRIKTYFDTQYQQWAQEMDHNKWKIDSVLYENQQLHQTVRHHEAKIDSVLYENQQLHQTVRHHEAKLNESINTQWNLYEQLTGVKRQYSNR